MVAAYPGVGGFVHHRVPARYLVLLLYGGFSSTQYALEYGERSYSSWRPYMAPIKIVACIGILLMLLQAFAVLFKDIARLRGEEL